MKKLYYAKREVDVIFASNTDFGLDLDREALQFLEEEIGNDSPNTKVKITIIASEDDIPKHWKGCLIWGIRDDATASEFLKCNDSEYTEYLRLKKKFQ